MCSALPSRSGSTGHHLRALLAALAFAVVACGGGDDDTSTGSTSTVVGEAGDPAPEGDGDGPEEAEEPDTDTTVPETTVPPTTEPPTTTAPPAPELDLSDLPDLVVEWDAAGSDSGVDPLDLVERLAGFPLPLAPPEGSSALRVDIDVFTDPSDPSAPWSWEWSYATLANGPVTDVDITLPGNGPGAEELATVYDPVLADLGWVRSGTTGSDPGEPGGPNTVNHVYTFEGDTLTIAGTPVEPSPAFVWLDEELVFEVPGTAGHRFDVGVEAPAGVVLSPILSALLEPVPVVTGGRLAGVELTSLERAPDSFEADEGLRYLRVTLELAFPGDAADDARTSFSEGLDGRIYRAAEESFFEPGFFEPAEPFLVGEGWQQPVLLLDRYPGRVTMTEDAASGEALVEIEVTLEPNRELLEPLPG